VSGEYKSDFARHYKAEGRAEMILAVLGARAVLIPDEVRVRLAECTDLEQLETWGRRAAMADSIEDVFN
jgi:type IV secretory pathway VirD2 relaxase